MERNDIGYYIDKLRGSSEEKVIDLYSLKKELTSLNEFSKVFDDLEKESMSFDKDALKQVEDLSLLMKIRNLASEIREKKMINDKLHSLHFNLNLLKNADINDLKPIKNVFNLFLYNNETKIDSIINELNDFKTKLDKIKKHHSNLLPKSLDNKLMIDEKYAKHINKLHSIHKKQKNVLISTIRLFLKMTRKHIKTLKRFKNIG